MRSSRKRVPGIIGTGALAAIFFTSMVGCDSTGGGAAKTSGDATLTVVAPVGDDWETVDTEAGRYFVKAIDGMADVVAFFR